MNSGRQGELLGEKKQTQELEVGRTGADLGARDEKVTARKSGTLAQCSGVGSGHTGGDVVDLGP